jgi:hypothetical protein
MPAKLNPSRCSQLPNIVYEHLGPDYFAASKKVLNEQDESLKTEEHIFKHSGWRYTTSAEHIAREPKP